MIINWVAAKAQQFLPVHDTGLDELSVNFDFALSAEIMELLYLYGQSNGGMDAGAVADDCINAESGIASGTSTESSEGIVAGARQQVEAAEAAPLSRFALDEHELALA